MSLTSSWQRLYKPLTSWQRLYQPAAQTYRSWFVLTKSVKHRPDSFHVSRKVECLTIGQRAVSGFRSCLLIAYFLGAYIYISGCVLRNKVNSSNYNYDRQTTKLRNYVE